MIYLLDEWFVDKSNKQRVRELIDELKTDIKDASSRSDDEIISDIAALGETTIAELLKRNKL